MNIQVGTTRVRVNVGALQGPAGPAGGTSILRRASIALSGHRVVREESDGDIEYADPSTPSGLTTVIGITTSAASSGADASIATSGPVVEPTWSWTPGGTVFLGAAGALTQTAPTTGILMSIGVATSATSILVRIGSPISLV